MFKKKYINNKLVFVSDLIPELSHCFTTRGVNIDDITQKFCCHEVIHPIQTHSSNIKFSKIGLNEYPDTDSVILTNTEQLLYLRFADCTPVIIYDKKANIGAIAHAGWRGTVASIVPKTVQKIIDYTHNDKKYIFVVIGPAIGECCYKVGEEVVTGIKNSVKDYSECVISKPDGDYVNLKQTNAQQLIELGVPLSNIDICPFCTSCNNDLFYSYRKEDGTDKRHYAIIKLNKLNHSDV